MGAPGGVAGSLAVLTRTMVSRYVLGGSRSEQAVRPRTARFWVRVSAGAVVAFALGWSAATAHALWDISRSPLQGCEGNLRTLFLASRRLPERSRRSHEAIRSVLKSEFLITEDEARYFAPRAARHSMTYIGPELEALVCQEDPEYGLKIGMALAGTLEFTPSYRWEPTGEVVVRCPYHGLALTTTGEVRSE